MTNQVRTLSIADRLSRVDRDLQSSIERVRASVFRAVFGSALLVWLAGLLFVLGCVVLALRAALDWPLARTSACFAILAVAPIVAWRTATRKQLSRAGAAAWLDVQSGSSGVVVTDFEHSDAAWSARVAESLSRAALLPRANLKKPALLALVALAFVVVALWVPIPRTPVGPPIALQQAAVERVEEKLATLEEEVALDPELAAEMRETLQRLKDEDALANPESAFEAVDHAEARLADEARSKAEAAEAGQEALAAASESAASDPEAAQKKLEEAMSALSKAGLAKGLPKGLENELGNGSLELPAGAKLDKGQIEKLSGGLSQKLGDKLAKLAKAGLLKPAQFGKSGKPAELAATGTGQCKNPGQGVGAVVASGVPGQGGPMHGPGDADMSWGKEAAGDTERFEAKTLPSAEYQDAEHSAVLGVGAAAPTIDPLAESGGLSAIDASTGKSAWRRRLAPHHREAVKTFFTREAPKQN